MKDSVGCGEFLFISWCLIVYSCCFGEVGWWFGSVDCGPVCFASIVAESSYRVHVCGGYVEWDGFVFDE